MIHESIPTKRPEQDMVDKADLLGQAGSGHGAQQHHHQHHTQGGDAHGSENGLGPAQRLSGGGGGGSSTVGVDPGDLGGGGGGGVARAERAASSGFRGAWRQVGPARYICVMVQLLLHQHTVPHCAMWLGIRSER